MTLRLFSAAAAVSRLLLGSPVAALLPLLEGPNLPPPPLPPPPLPVPTPPAEHSTAVPSPEPQPATAAMPPLPSSRTASALAADTDWQPVPAPMLSRPGTAEGEDVGSEAARREALLQAELESKEVSDVFVD